MWRYLVPSTLLCIAFAIPTHAGELGGPDLGSELSGSLFVEYHWDRPATPAPAHSMGLQFERRGTDSRWNAPGAVDRQRVLRAEWQPQRPWSMRINNVDVNDDGEVTDEERLWLLGTGAATLIMIGVIASDM